ncbi:pentatricopeptide repeat-containing protein At2g13600-like [Zingiber officinale]|uniref:pentatricopeptide repeat-containing protein At2g13600-like n=1 Tax=Zingiber officinale TaxID=94328 RepID=UPI001C4CF15A|nr:pentatricopeptide repeat-containing protein At2g13600-like [Zingiber officinale]
MQSIDAMPIQPDSSVWGALIAACRKFRNLELDSKVAQKLFRIEPHNSDNYVLFSNMYASHGMLEEAKEIRRLMQFNGVRKETGCSIKQDVCFHMINRTMLQSRYIRDVREVEGVGEGKSSMG